MYGKKFIMTLLCLFIFVGFIGTAQANKPGRVCNLFAHAESFNKPKPALPVKNNIREIRLPREIVKRYLTIVLGCNP